MTLNVQRQESIVNFRLLRSRRVKKLCREHSLLSRTSLTHLLSLTRTISTISHLVLLFPMRSRLMFFELTQLVKKPRKLSSEIAPRMGLLKKPSLNPSRDRSLRPWRPPIRQSSSHPHRENSSSTVSRATWPSCFLSSHSFWMTSQS